MLLFVLLRRIQQVPAVFYNSGSGDTPLEHLRVEIVTVAQVGEAHYIVNGLALFDERNRRYDFDFETFCKEMSALGVYFQKATLWMSSRQLFHMFVHDLAAKRAVAVKLAHDMLAFLACLEEFFLVGHLWITSVSFCLWDKIIE